jgi:hypothetical protein
LCYRVGMYVKVRVRTGAKKESVEQLKGDRFAVSVKEPAERNQANERVVELIAAHFKSLLPRSASRAATTRPPKSSQFYKKKKARISPGLEYHLE